MTFRASVDEIVEENSSGLLAAHESWERVHLTDICSILNGFPFPSAGFDPSDGFPLLRIRDIRPGMTETKFLGKYEPMYVVKPGNLVVGMDGDFNAAEWAGPPALLNQRVCKLTPDERWYSKKLLAYALQGYLNAINAATPSMTVKHLSSTTVGEIPLPLPPRAEQDRLVTELDDYTTRLDEATVLLDRVQHNLKRYRASVLKAAVEGRLVPTEAELARAEKRDYEPASVLVKRILVERRRRWEAEGKRGKYQEPEAPDTKELPELPRGWCWARASALFWDAGYGTSQKCDYNASGPRVLRIPNVQGGSLDLSDVKRATVSTRLSPDGFVGPGDFLFIRTNGSKNLIGRGALVRERLTPDHHFASYLIRLRLVPIATMPSWFALAWHAPTVRDQLLADAASGAGQHNVSLGLAADYSVPLPPAAEQTRILAAVEQVDSIARASEAMTTGAVRRSTRLRQSILKWAFDGKLVDQDPNDEPADALLARIRAEKTAAESKHPPSRRRTAKRKS